MIYYNNYYKITNNYNLLYSLQKFAILILCFYLKYFKIFYFIKYNLIIFI